MTERQKQLLNAQLRSHKATKFLHGCCKGADEEADLIAYELGISRVFFPADRQSAYEVCKQRGTDWLVAKASLNPLKRNDAMVRVSSLLIAAPRQEYEIRRSGTWSTVRYARKYDVPVIVLTP